MIILFIGRIFTYYRYLISLTHFLFNFPLSALSCLVCVSVFLLAFFSYIYFFEQIHFNWFTSFQPK